MSVLLTELEQQAGTLVPEERAQLVEALLKSLHDVALPEIETAWEREIEKRVTAFDKGELQTWLAEEVFAEAKSMVQ
jgi:putative addiction module component (TIGR02574 family)